MKGKGILQNRFSSIVLAVGSTLLASWIAYQADIPNPVIILVVIMIFFTSMIDNAAGMASGLCIIGYALFFFSIDHSFIRFKPIGAYKCFIIVLSLIIIYIMVALIRKRKDEAYAKLMALNSQLEKQNAVLEQESDHDALTGVYNRRGGDRMVAQFINEEMMKMHPDFSAVMVAMDIDNFKGINDSYGHGAGDTALTYFVKCLKKEFPNHRVIIRNGGDEFQMLLYDIVFDEISVQLQNFATRLFSFHYREYDIGFHISCGYAIFPMQASSQKELYRKADAALYCVKMNGKHKAMIYSDDFTGNDQVMLNFSMRNLSAHLPMAFMVYRADESERILLVSDTLLELCDCDDFREFMTYTGGSFRGFVAQADVERIEESISQQIKANRYGLDVVDYQIVTRKGKVRQIHDLGRIVYDPHMGDLFYVALYDAEMLKDASMETIVDGDIIGELDMEM